VHFAVITVAFELPVDFTLGGILPSALAEDD
jgi:hypothetical protein